MCTKSFWNTFHQVHSKLNDWIGKSNKINSLWEQDRHNQLRLPIHEAGEP